MKVVEWEIGRVKPYEKNPRIIPEEAVERVAASIREFGFQQPIVVDKDGVIIVGHTRLKAAEMLGLEKAPVVVADLSPEKARAYRLADNKTNEATSWDINILDGELADLSSLGLDFTMDVFGFDVDTISPDGFFDDFSLPDGDKGNIVQITFTLSSHQADTIQAALELIDEDTLTETFGNSNTKGNKLYKVVKEWAEQRK